MKTQSDNEREKLATMTQERDRYKAALKYYADEKNWHISKGVCYWVGISGNGYECARNTLAEVGR